VDLPATTRRLGADAGLLLRTSLAESSLVSVPSLTSSWPWLQYVYHRSCHEIDFLWHIHQHHHTTKHPTAILSCAYPLFNGRPFADLSSIISILAEDYQEYLEILLIPLLASILVPMTFSEMYLTLCYTIVRILLLTLPRSWEEC
jgi:hypothetical protein